MLDNQSIEILQFIKESREVTLEQLTTTFNEILNISSSVDFLVKLNYIEGTEIPYYRSDSTILNTIKLDSYIRGPYKITPTGVAYLESIEKQRKQSYAEQTRYTEEKRRSWIQFWVPLIISNLISLSALIVAILAYLKQ